MTKNCILCGKETNGSIGAAGLHWSMICQPCKDKEDKVLEAQIINQAKAFDLVEGLCKL